MKKNELFKELGEIYKSLKEKDKEYDESGLKKNILEQLRTAKKYLDSSIEKIQILNPETAERLSNKIESEISSEISSLEKYPNISYQDFENFAENKAVAYLELVKEYSKEDNKDFYDIGYCFNFGEQKKYKDFINLIKELKHKIDIEIVFNDYDEKRVSSVNLLINSASYDEFEKELDVLMPTKNKIISLDGMSKRQYFIAPFLLDYPEEPAELIRNAFNEKNVQNTNYKYFTYMGYSSSEIFDYARENVFDAIKKTFENVSMFNLKDKCEMIFNKGDIEVKGLNPTLMYYSDDEIKYHELETFEYEKIKLKNANIIDDVKRFIDLGEEINLKKKTKNRYI